MSRIRVGEIMERITKKPAIVKEDATLLEVVRALLEDPKTQVVYVVDSRGKLSGIITHGVILQYAYHDDIPPEYLEFNTSIIQGENIKARDLMLPPVFVRKDSPLEEAFRTMFEYKLTEIPVVDEDMHIIGDIHGLELLEAWYRERS